MGAVPFGRLGGFAVGEEQDRVMWITSLGDGRQRQPVHVGIDEEWKVSQCMTSWVIWRENYNVRLMDLPLCTTPLEMMVVLLPCV